MDGERGQGIEREGQGRGVKGRYQTVKRESRLCYGVTILFIETLASLQIKCNKLIILKELQVGNCCKSMEIQKNIVEGRERGAQMRLKERK